MAADVTYDPDADALSINFGSSAVATEGEEVSPGLIMHFDDAGRIVAISVLHASTALATGAIATVPQAAE